MAVYFTKFVQDHNIYKAIYTRIPYYSFYHCLLSLFHPEWNQVYAVNKLVSLVGPIGDISASSVNKRNPVMSEVPQEIQAKA